MKKVIVCIVLLLMCIPQMTFASVPASSGQGNYLDQANALKALGLFQGTSQGFELNRSPTRAEGAVMLVRLLGKEQEAKSNISALPFRDVPEWAKPAVSYLYQHKLSQGVSSSLYGSNHLLTSQQYSTMLLRALGYSDQDGDFTWNQALEMIGKLNIVDKQQLQELQSSAFLRDHIALLSYQALQTKLKESTQTLAESLVEQGVLSQTAAVVEGVIYQKPVHISNPSGVTILRTLYGSIDIVTRENEMPDALSQYSSIAVKSFDNMEEFNQAVRDLEQDKLDFKEFLSSNVQTTGDTLSVRRYTLQLIKGGWTYNSGDPQTIFSYVIVFYDRWGHPLGYDYQTLPEDQDNPPTSERVYVTADKQIFSGISLEITGTKPVPGPDQFITTVDLKANKSELPSFLTETSAYYITILSDAKPLDLVQNGIPKSALDPFLTLYNVLPFSRGGQVDYVAVVIYDEHLNVVAFYETSLK